MLVRRTFTIEATLPQERPNAASDWVQQFFDYFHPSLQAIVKDVSAGTPIALLQVVVPDSAAAVKLDAELSGEPDADLLG